MSRIRHSRRLRRIQSARRSAGRKIQTPHAKDANQTAAESSRSSSSSPQVVVQEACRAGRPGDRSGGAATSWAASEVEQQRLGSVASCRARRGAASSSSQGGRNQTSFVFSRGPPRTPVTTPSPLQC